MKFIAQVPAAAPLKSDWKENVFWMSGGEEDRVQYWQARWATGQSQWHTGKPHQYLVKVSTNLNLIPFSTLHSHLSVHGFADRRFQECEVLPAPVW